VIEDINIVWLKRDLRTQDHAALEVAEKHELPYLILFLFEPELIEYPDTSLRHLQFCYHSIQSMDKELEPNGKKVVCCYGNALRVFQLIVNQFNIKNVFSYQESGIQVTWERDKKLKQLFDRKSIQWLQFQRDGVIRGIENRSNWDKKWYAKINGQIIQNTYSKQEDLGFKNNFSLPEIFEERVKEYPIEYQLAGENNAWKYLRSFTKERGFNYHRHISKPWESRTSCARISPFLAWGNLSVRQAVHHVYFHPNKEKNKRAFTGMLTRLNWHCHFIQKFEQECSYETICINRGYEKLERVKNESFIQAWKDGLTGFPLVDANMRCVKATGWINFRMRAMVVSLLTHHLDQDWRTGVYHLANQFLDYEPGIHYPQFQMQAGTTGTNTVRIYNPTKNSIAHDEDGSFIKKWVPELRNVPPEFIHEPGKMTLLDQSFCETIIGKDYPAPIINLEKTGKVARDKIWGHRSDLLVKQENRRIVQTHIKQ
jgi:deoxyribodipyrimidine photo-lyase